jgi:hypothetical protein
LVAFTAREDNEVEKTGAQNALRPVIETDSGVRVRQMNDADLERILELRSIVRWSADPRAFELLLARALSATRGKPVQVIVTDPAGCQAHSLLQEFGFEGTEDRMRMELALKTTTCRTSLVHYGTTPYLAT